MRQHESQQNTDVQEVPANVFSSGQRVTIAAPMPGQEPENISVVVSAGPVVTLHADLRGALKGDKELIRDEWTPGPYHREVELPNHVDGQRANLTYNNGVLVVALPVAERTTPATLTFGQTSGTHGERIGNRGRNLEGDTGKQRGAGESTTSHTSGETI
jgi:HSP20 family protein